MLAAGDVRGEAWRQAVTAAGTLVREDFPVLRHGVDDVNEAVAGEVGEGPARHVRYFVAESGAFGDCEK